MENQLIEAIKKANRVFVCGNGGSAATAEHFTNDLFSRGIKAFCLNSNVSIMTMIANDFGYERIFSKQVQLYAEEGDILITISCSGTSPNIKRAQLMALEKGINFFPFKTFSEDELALEHNERDYEGLEDEHMILVHKIRRALK